VKREDALMLANYFAYLEPARQAAPESWLLQTTDTWRLTLTRAQKLAADLIPA
jgi:hypothetical protein